MNLLGRMREANAYFELSKAILECELGAHHERSLTVKSIINSIGFLKS
jgi:hypothetical protein